MMTNLKDKKTSCHMIVESRWYGDTILLIRVANVFCDKITVGNVMEILNKNY